MNFVIETAIKEKAVIENKEVIEENAVIKKR